MESHVVYNETHEDDMYDYYLYNDTDRIAYYENKRERFLLMYKTIDRERNMFRVFYQVLSAFIVVANLCLIVAVLISRKQRSHFRNWLLMHMTVIHILFGAISCPFLGHKLAKPDAGLGTIWCKLLSYVSDSLEYSSNVSLVIFGIYQCVTMLSPRMLKGVSHTLLTSIMIIIPWLMCVMLTAVLRLTMSEEVYGQCYQIHDKTAQILWIVLAYGLPLGLIFLCFIAVCVIACSPFITAVESSPPGRHNMRVFVAICLGSCVLMRTPFHFVYSAPIDTYCNINLDALTCLRLTHSLDIVRLSNMVLIPLAYLIPTEIRKCCRKLRSKSLCKSLPFKSSSHKQRLEMVTTRRES